MQIAILVGANPKTANITARIRLRKGIWSLVHEGLIDSILTLHVLTPHVELGDRHIEFELRSGLELPKIQVDKVCLIYIEWKSRGTEKYINLLAKLVDENGIKSS